MRLVLEIFHCNTIYRRKSLLAYVLDNSLLVRGRYSGFWFEYIGTAKLWFPSEKAKPKAMSQKPQYLVLNTISLQIIIYNLTNKHNIFDFYLKSKKGRFF